MEKNAYDFSFKKPNGEALPLKEFKGKTLLIVNTASECGFTKQYAGLEALYQNYKDRGLVLIGVPSNDFGGQEPGNDQAIQEFCKSHFKVTFPVTCKEVIVGDKSHPFYVWVREKLFSKAVPKWNFYKFLISGSGHLENYFSSITSPENKKLIRAIENLLKGPS